MGKQPEAGGPDCPLTFRGIPPGSLSTLPPWPFSPPGAGFHSSLSSSGVYLQLWEFIKRILASRVLSSASARVARKRNGLGCLAMDQAAGAEGLPAQE